MYDKILVPLDGTKTDNTILEHLVKLSKIHNSYLYLIRVLHYHTRDELSYETKKAATYLKDKVSFLKQHHIRAESIIEYGEASEIIIEKVKKLNVDLIAMATHGHGWLIDILFGSTAHKVRHSVFVPVLMIRSKKAT